MTSHDDRQGLSAVRARTVTMIVTLAIAALVSGCGGASSDSGAVAATLKNYLTSLANGDGARACDQLTTDEALQLVQAAAGLGASTCVQAIADTSQDLGGSGKDVLLSARVVNVQIMGDTATADVVGGTQTAHFTKIGGRWLISGGIAAQ